MKKEKGKIRINEEKFWCIHCGERFRYKTNKVQHEKKCLDRYNSYEKYKDVVPNK